MGIRRDGGAGKFVSASNRGSQREPFAVTGSANRPQLGEVAEFGDDRGPAFPVEVGVQQDKQLLGGAPEREGFDRSFDEGHGVEFALCMVIAPVRTLTRAEAVSRSNRGLEMTRVASPATVHGCWLLGTAAVPVGLAISSTAFANPKQLAAKSTIGGGQGAARRGQKSAAPRESSGKVASHAGEIRVRDAVRIVLVSLIGSEHDPAVGSRAAPTPFIIGILVELPGAGFISA